ncbi:MAG: nucleotide sugar dehydrogenase [Candidatus Aenigmarchaeota archaeon]|nr:nucleotide sugar dehydrogenase [Candidatus Aenigmarchaeota archaeon]
MDISVIGLGYIGLPTACLLARAGHRVMGVDVNERLVDGINNGATSIDEQDFLELFRQHRPAAATKPAESDVFIICVPTPLDGTSKACDMSAVRSAAYSVKGKLRTGNLVILESTVPAGASKATVIPILEESGLKAGRDFHYAYCPERAFPESLLNEMVNNCRIIGGFDEESGRRAETLYRSFVKGEIIRTGMTEAETVKLMENTYRAVNIALADEFALISEKLGIDVWEAIRIANKHPRVGILKPGPGIGGHCIPIDPLFLVESTESQFIPLAIEISESMPGHVLEQARLVSGKDAPSILILGAAYKGNVNDIRESPSLKMAAIAQQKGWRVGILDPHIQKYAYSMEEFLNAVKGCDCVILATDHSEFREIDLGGVQGNGKLLVDTRNFLDHKKWEAAGFRVKVIGNGRQGRG